MFTFFNKICNTEDKFQANIISKHTKIKNTHLKNKNKQKILYFTNLSRCIESGTKAFLLFLLYIPFLGYFM